MVARPVESVKASSDRSSTRIWGLWLCRTARISRRTSSSVLTSSSPRRRSTLHGPWCWVRTSRADLLVISLVLLGAVAGLGVTENLSGDVGDAAASISGLLAQQVGGSHRRQAVAGHQVADGAFYHHPVLQGEAQLVGEGILLAGGQPSRQDLLDQVGVGAQGLTVGVIPVLGLVAVDVQGADRAAAERDRDSGHCPHVLGKPGWQPRPAAIGVQVLASDRPRVDVGLVTGAVPGRLLGFFKRAAAII